MKSKQPQMHLDKDNNRKIRDRVYESLSHVATSFASPARMKIIQFLAQGNCSVEEIARDTGESVANTSQHLQRLAKAGLLMCERQGVSRIYKIQSPRVLALWEGFQALGHELDRSLDEHEDLLTDPSLRASETAEEVLDLVRRNKAVLLDARYERESRSTGVPGAIAVPLESLSEAGTIKGLRISKSKAVFVFCRGRYCALASQAVRILRERGFSAYRLRESAFQLRLIQGGRA